MATTLRARLAAAMESAAPRESRHHSALSHPSAAAAAAAALVPILSSCYFKPCNASASASALDASVFPPMMRMRALFSTSTSTSSTRPAPEVQNFKLPPPVNPPDPENPDRTTLRAQWDHAVRMYARMYSHAWGTAILAGVSLFGIGWWIKGENPLKALSPAGELKEEETAE